MLSANSLDVRMLSWALRRFANLKLLDIDYLYTHLGTDTLKSCGILDPISEGGDLVTEDLEYTLPVALRALSASKTVIKTFRTRRRKKGQFDHVQSVSSVHAGCTVHITASQRLVCEAIGQIFTFLSQSEFDSAFNQLRTLKIGTSQVSSRHKSTAMTSAIGNLINVAPCLETMKIGPIAFPRWFSFEEMFWRQIRLRSLRSLSVDGLIVPEVDDLTGFFSNHSATLVNVYLKGIYIVDWDWINVLACLRKLTFPVLKVFCLDCCGLVDDVRDVIVYVQNYILQYTDKMPFERLRKRSDLGTLSGPNVDQSSSESSSPVSLPSSRSSSPDSSLNFRSSSSGSLSDTDTSSP